MSISELFRASNPGINPTTPGVADTPGIRKGQIPTGPSEFQKVLEKEQGVSLSSHAETRIRSREIPWDDALKSRVNEGINRLEEKGSREALILAGDVAFIANVRSRTIVTAMDKSQLKERTFTNIDSAVIV